MQGFIEVIVEFRVNNIKLGNGKLFTYFGFGATRIGIVDDFLVAICKMQWLLRKKMRVREWSK